MNDNNPIPLNRI